MKKLINSSGILYNAISYEVTEKTGEVDYDMVLVPNTKDGAHMRELSDSSACNAENFFGILYKPAICCFKNTVTTPGLVPELLQIHLVLINYQTL